MSWSVNCSQRCREVKILISQNMIFRFFKLLAVDVYTNLVGYRGRLKFLKPSGYACFYHELTGNVSDRIVAEIDKVLDDDVDAGIWSDECGSDKRIFRFERVMPELKELLKISEKISDIERYTGRQVTNWYLMANKVDYVKGNEGSGGGLHRDSPFAHQIKYIYYLSDVTSQNGPFAYADGTHRSILRQGNLGVMRYQTASENPTLSEIVGKRGTLLVADTRGLHQGIPIVAGCRYALTLYTFHSSKAAKNSLENLGLKLIAA